MALTSKRSCHSPPLTVSMSPESKQLKFQRRELRTRESRLCLRRLATSENTIIIIIIVTAKTMKMARPDWLQM